MNKLLRFTGLSVWMAALAIFLSAGCPQQDKKEAAAKGGIGNIFWKISGSTYYAQFAVAYVSGSTIILTCDTTDVLNAQRLEFSLQGAADGMGMAGGLRVGKYELGPSGSNNLYMDWGLGGNTIMDKAVSGHITITAHDGINGKLSAILDCITDKGKPVTGEFYDVHID
jgi:hypothetical protein